MNTSRGPVADERALFLALKEQWIAAAGLVVFEEEPMNIDNPLLDLDNVVLTPHVAGSTWECRRRCALMAVENTLRVLEAGEAFVFRHLEHPPAIIIGDASAKHI